MNSLLKGLSCLLVVASTAMATNTPPTVVVLSAEQRPGTTLMDIDYRVDDPDDATVETAVLGFINGGTNLADIIKVNTLVEGTDANIGANIPANTVHRLTWNVGADWTVDTGNVQMEVLASDGRSLLPFHWITLPADGADPEIAINEWPLHDGDFLPLWYWLLANDDPAIRLTNGIIYGVGGRYGVELPLAEGAATMNLGREFLYERLDIRALTGAELTRASAGSYGFQALNFSSVARGFAVQDRLYAWGDQSDGKAAPPLLPDVEGVGLGHDHTLIARSDRTILAFGRNNFSQSTVPLAATNIIAVSAGYDHSLALRADGSVVCWGRNNFEQNTIPPTATNVTAISAGANHNLAMRADGSVVAWGANYDGQRSVPAVATNVTAIAAGGNHNLVMRGDGSIIGWGLNSSGQTTVPAGATNVVAIAAGGQHSLALREDGSVIAWGHNAYGQTDVPATATNVTAIATAGYTSLALRADGRVIAWGRDNLGQTDVPAGLIGVDQLGNGANARHVIVLDKHSP